MGWILKLAILVTFSANVVAFGNFLHSEGHPAFGYEIIIVVDKAIRYAGARTSSEVRNAIGQLISPTGQTMSVFHYHHPIVRGEECDSLRPSGMSPQGLKLCISPQGE